MKNRSLIWFTVWSSLVHGGIMAVQALNMPAEQGHFLADVPALLIVAIVLAVLMPRGEVVGKIHERRITEKWAGSLTFRIFRLAIKTVAVLRPEA